MTDPAPPLLLDTADEVAHWLRRYGVTVRHIHQWARRGHITRHPGNLYCAREIADWYDYRRNARMDDVRRGIDASQVTP